MNAGSLKVLGRLSNVARTVDARTVSNMTTNGENDQSAYSKAELRKRLTPLQYHVTQEKGTERAFTGKFYKLKNPGIYSCVVCDTELFSSDTKYDSGSGWPAFYDVIEQGRVTLKQDMSHVGGNLLLLVANPGLVRTEVSCTNCRSHLGHVFPDGPKPTGKRFCLNSSALDFHSRHNSVSSTEEQQQQPEVCASVTISPCGGCGGDFGRGDAEVPPQGQVKGAS